MTRNGGGHPHITAAALLVEVGRQLAARRKQLGLSPADVETKGGPTNKTVTKAERGIPIRHDLLARIAEVLGLDLIDLYTSILRITPFSAEALSVARVYDRTGEAGKTALREVAKALDRQR